MKPTAAQIARAKELVAEKQKAYSVINVRDIEERKEDGQDVYVVKGVASTPRVDRMGDIVVPTGARYALPLPFMLYHDSHEPVGRVIGARPSKKEIPFEAVIPKVAEPGVVKDRIDEAVHSLKYRLIGAVSIGFRATEDDIEFLEDGGIQFNGFEWLELSLVVIPANPEARITSFKSFDEDVRAALRAKHGRVVRLDKPLPGASGSTAANGRNPVKPYKEQIKDLEATRAANVAALAEIQKLAAEKGETKDAEQREKFDTLVAEIEAIDTELKDLKALEKLAIAAAEPVDNTKGKTVTQPPAGSAARVTINAKLDPGIRFARMAQCVARAMYLQRSGRFMAPADIYRSEKGWMDSAPEVHIALKAAVNADDSTTAGGASEWAYAQNIASEFVEFLRPLTLLGRIPGFRNVPFNIRVGGMDGGSTGFWAGQGLGIAVSRPTSTSISLGITKVGGLCVITKELAMLSTPSAELMVRNDLAKALQQKADTSLIDPNSGGTTNVQPASLTYGVTARQASGTDFAAFKADWKSITSPFYAANIPLAGSVVIMKEELAEALSMMVTSLGLPQFPSMQDWAGGNARLMGRQVFTTQVADTSGSPDFDNLLILLQPGEVFLADDGGASVEASDQVSIEMSDAPGNKSSATATGASLVSMFQTDSIAIKALRHVNWTKARSQACQYIRTAAYV